LNHLNHLGAGQGADLATAHAIWPDAKLIGVESYPPYVEDLLAEGISVLPINIEQDQLPFANESVDVIIANQVLEHCKEVFGFSLK
jgi:trans-aconitate methyltransferase